MAGQRLSEEQYATIKAMLAAGRSPEAIARAVGCCRKTVCTYRDKITGRRPKRQCHREEPWFLSAEHIAQIGKAEADRLIAAGKQAILTTGWWDESGEWRPPTNDRGSLGDLH
ncbi:unnamed protein product [marine sediment metagenome]|uniref:Uncharacterized protein n=1 Tax=marine sediment metagenome TaxID=412755 RepID=X0VQQ2_9ZZZZ